MPGNLPINPLEVFIIDATGIIVLDTRPIVKERINFATSDLYGPTRREFLLLEIIIIIRHAEKALFSTDDLCMYNIFYWSSNYLLIQFFHEEYVQSK